MFIQNNFIPLIASIHKDMPENTILLLQPAHIKWGVEKLDELLNFKEWIKNPLVAGAAEMIDGSALDLSLNGINKKVSPLIPDEYKDEIHAALDDVIDSDEDYEDAVSAAIDVLDELKDKLKASPFVLKLIDALLDVIEAVLLSLLEKAEKE